MTHVDQNSVRQLSCRHSSGQTLVVVAVALVLLIGMLGLAAFALAGIVRDQDIAIGNMLHLGRLSSCRPAGDLDQLILAWGRQSSTLFGFLYPGDFGTG
jgi:hypothetical protein